MPEDEITRLPEDSSGGSLLSEGQSFGQYKVIRLLGRGGMGEVYEVQHAVIRRRFALKLVNREIMARPEAMQRFQREAEVMANLDHANIVRVDDFGETDGHSWLRMELVCGSAVTNLEDRGQESVPSEATRLGAERTGTISSLGDVLTGEPLPESLVVDLLKQILGGLDYAHNQGVVHRDIKPSNILLASDSEDLSVPLASLSGKKITPKITDFGLVRLAGEQWLQSQVQLTVARSMVDSDKTHLENTRSGSAGTSTQALLGTFEFMAPEQKQGQEATAQSDLYSVGLIAFRMLTGESVPGFKGPSRINPALSPAWDEWVERAMESRPEARFASAQEMEQAMPSGEAAMAGRGSRMADRGSAGTSGAARDSDGSAGASRAAPTKSTKKGFWIGLVALLLLGGAFGYYFGFVAPERERQAELAKKEVDDSVRLQRERERRDAASQEELARVAAQQKAEQEHLAELETERKAEEERKRLEAEHRSEEKRKRAEASSSPEDLVRTKYLEVLSQIKLDDVDALFSIGLKDISLINEPEGQSAAILHLLRLGESAPTLSQEVIGEAWDMHYASVTKITDPSSRISSALSVLDMASVYSTKFGEKYARLIRVS